MDESYLFLAVIINVLIIGVILLVSYKEILRYKVASDHYIGIARNEKIRTDTYKEVGVTIERINRAVRTMNLIECQDIETTIGSEVRRIVFAALHPSTSEIYNMIVSGGIRPDEDSKQADTSQ